MNDFAAAHALLDGDGQEPIPTVAELAQTHIAQGSSALLPIGISYQAHWKEPADGMAKHARQQVKALAMTGLPVQLQAFGQQIILNDELGEEAKRVEYLAGISFSYTALSIKQVIPFSPQGLKQMLYPLGVVNYMKAAELDRLWRSTIVYTSWERDRVHGEYVELFNQMGQIWLPCEANKRAFVRSGVDERRVKVVPYPYSPEEHMLAAPRGAIIPPVIEKKRAPKKFYAIGKWEPRKNQHQLIGAFLQAFTPKDKASLFIKTSGFGIHWARYPNYQQSIQHWLDSAEVKSRGWDLDSFNRLVRVVDRKLPDEEIQALHKMNNIYVSAGLGEAWDIPAFEAKLAGNRLVYVGNGGPEDYATPDDVKVDWGATELVHAGYLWERDARWASVPMPSMVAALKKAQPCDMRITPTSFARKYSMFAVANTMQDNIRELAQELGCWEQLEAAGGFG